MPKFYASTAPGRATIPPDGMTDEERKTVCFQLAEDARDMLLRSHRLPSTLYLENYRFCIWTQHIRELARRYNIVEDIKKIAFWAFD